MTQGSQIRQDVQKRLSAHKRRRPRKARVGESPTALHVPEGADQTTVRLVRYDASSVTQFKPGDPAFWKAGPEMRWIEVCGLGDKDQITDIAQRLDIHPLTIADFFHVDQRPKTEIAQNYLQIVLKAPVGGLPFVAEQVTIILGQNFVLSLREHSTAQPDPVRSRLEEGGARIRSSSAYLAYALIDAVIDGYFPILESYGDVTEALEERILLNPQEGAIRDIHLLKRELLDLRHALWPQREAVNALLRDDVPFIDEALITYLRDCSDHSFQLLDMVEVYREVAQGLVDLHLSSQSNRMNEVMKVLTMIATIFIPMTFIAGVYGMNFDRGSPWNLPELGWRFGYFYALGLMAISSMTMLFVFWRMGWIFGRLRARGKRRKGLAGSHGLPK